MGYFTAGFLQFSSTNAKISLMDGQLGSRYQIQAFQEFS